MPDTFVPFPKRYLSLARRPHSVLLLTARCDEENYRSYLFVEPERMLTAASQEELPALFAAIDEALSSGNFVAGHFSYECGEHFVQLPPYSAPGALPLAQLGVYRRAHIFDHRTGTFEDTAPEPQPEPSAEGVALWNARLGISEENYRARIDAIHEYIRAGETYQVNFTDKLTFGFSGEPLALFAALSAAQPVPFCAFIHAGDAHILSFSPELFFRIGGRRILARPMKGTAPRGSTAEADAAIAAWLRSDPKNCAENAMIVDLLRNDLGRLCEYGSVKVEKMFAVESHPTLFQMTSTVCGLLRRGLSHYQIFEAVFPCGSITGAPKHRTMQIIRRLEQQPRGGYTGAIGFFHPNGDAVFNVAIRTIVLRGELGEMGVGGGITIDSCAAGEYCECLLKAEFLTAAAPEFELIESLRWDGGYPLLPLHIERMQASAACFGFAFDAELARRRLLSHAAGLASGAAFKVRLTLERQGGMAVTSSPVGAPESGLVAISPVRTSLADRLLLHKTTRRSLYETMLEAGRKHGCDDVLFFNERGELTEGAINNVFVETAGKLHTPPIACGLLPGVFRRHWLLEDPTISERVLTFDDLMRADAVFICNAVRGRRKVKVWPEELLGSG